MIITNNLIFGREYGLDVDVINFISATGITDVNYTNSLNTLVTSLKSNEIYEFIQCWHIYFGNENKSKFNFIAPYDNDASYRLTFNGTGTVNNDGYLGNGINAYANTHFVSSVQQISGSIFALIAVGTNNIVIQPEAIEFGAFNSGYTSIITKLNNVDYRRRGVINFGAFADQTGVNEAKGIWTISQQTLMEFKRNNSLVATGTVATTMANVPYFDLSLNLFGSAYGYSSQRLQQRIIGQGLSSAKIAILTELVDNFENALGRKTW